MEDKKLQELTEDQTPELADQQLEEASGGVARPADDAMHRKKDRPKRAAVILDDVPNIFGGEINGMPSFQSSLKK